MKQKINKYPSIGNVLEFVQFLNRRRKGYYGKGRNEKAGL